MATRTSSIHVLGVGGKDYTYQFPIETFHNTTISELKHEVQVSMGTDINSRLIFGREELQAVRYGREMTFGDYRILDRSAVRLDWYLVDLMMQIHVKLLTGGTLTLEVEPGLTVLEVKEMLEFLTEVDPDEIRLLFGGRQLEDNRTMWDYRIQEESNLQMIQRLRGGGHVAAVTFTDITSQEKFIMRNFSKKENPKWRRIVKGLNFRGTCRNGSCEACNRTVFVRKGFCTSSHGLCNLARSLTEMNCPVCDQHLRKRDINGIYIYKCTLKVEGKVVDGERFDFTVESKGNCYKRALSTNDDDYRDYDYLELTVKPLDLPTSPLEPTVSTPPAVPKPSSVSTPPAVPKPSSVSTPPAVPKPSGVSTPPAVPKPSGVSTPPAVPKPSSVSTPRAGPNPQGKPTKRNKIWKLLFGSE